MREEELPQVSVIAPVYGHKPYLRAAIDSILALDYPNLEIIIQDDASPDDAFEVLERIVSAYSGPHKVKLGRNAENMSMATYNVLMERATSQYIVVAHDDDVQYPHRVRRQVDVMRQRRVSLVASSVRNIDPMGAPMGMSGPKFDGGDVSVSDLARHGFCNMWGASLSWDRGVFDTFGPIDIEGTARTSDWILPFRAALLKGAYFLDEALLDRRIHSDSRGQIGRTGESKNVRSVELASEQITQTAYRLETLDRYEETMSNQQGHDIVLIKRQLKEYLADRARVLGKGRNRLHMENRRMAWIERQKPNKVAPRMTLGSGLSAFAQRTRAFVRSRRARRSQD